MTQLDRATKEIELACKYENPDWDGKTFDYGCSCYQSALKAFKSLCEDGHSGSSFHFTRNILERLMWQLPLTSIKDEDFIEDKSTVPSDAMWLKEQQLKSDIQCSRMSSLFRYEHLDGKITYTDVDRVYCVPIYDESATYSIGVATKIVDELYPIKMPYYPTIDKYRMYTDSILDKDNNEIVAFLYVVTPDGTRKQINRFMKYVKGELIDCTEEQYLKAKQK